LGRDLIAGRKTYPASLYNQDIKRRPPSQKILEGGLRFVKEPRITELSAPSGIANVSTDVIDMAQQVILTFNLEVQPGQSENITRNQSIISRREYKDYKEYKGGWLAARG
jgi:hypothetical protein